VVETGRQDMRVLKGVLLVVGSLLLAFIVVGIAFSNLRFSSGSASSAWWSGAFTCS